MKKTLALLFFALGGKGAFSQSIDTVFSELPDSVNVPWVLQDLHQKPYLEAHFKIGALTNSLSFTKILNFLNDDFLDEAEKRDLIGDGSRRLRFGYVQETGFSYKNPGYKIFDVYKKGQGLGIRNQFFQSGNLGGDVQKLLFFGNQPYADQTLDLSRSAYSTWYFTSLDYHFEVLMDSAKPLAMTFSIVVGHGHNSYKSQGATLFTQPDGEFLDLDLHYKISETRTLSQPLGGLGVSLGAEKRFRLSPTSAVLVRAQDVGIVQWNNGRSFSVDSTFRFRGLTVDNLFDVNDSLAESEAAHLKATLFPQKGDGYLAFLPFALRAEYVKVFRQGWFSGLGLNAQYRYLPGYLPKVGARLFSQLSPKQELTLEVSGGGFNVWSLNVGYHLKISRDWQLQLAVQNLNGLAVPSSAGGAALGAGLSYRL